MYAKWAAQFKRDRYVAQSEGFSKHPFEGYNSHPAQL